MYPQVSMQVWQMSPRLSYPDLFLSFVHNIADMQTTLVSPAVSRRAAFDTVPSPRETWSVFYIVFILFCVRHCIVPSTAKPFLLCLHASWDVCVRMYIVHNRETKEERPINKAWYPGGERGKEKRPKKVHTKAVWTCRKARRSVGRSKGRKEVN